jgi:predicted signal transduction protein with EAL and GGDEF domain
VAGRLQSATRGGESIARLGGDEFAVLIEPNRRPVETAELVAARILEAIAEPIELDDQTVTVSASIGISGADPSATAGSLLRDADVAMYKAKTSGKNRWVVYDAAMRIAVVEDLQLASDLAAAVPEGQLALVYQPVVELETDRVVGFEALVRWHHPALGVVPPDRFIPLAEENGMIVALGAWVLEEACHTAAQWAAQHPEQDLTMAVNISARQLACPDLVEQVKAALDSSGLDPRRLVLEMTETALVRDATVAARRLHELRHLGIRLAIDDFGTGYSSLSYLRQFPVDILKIDRSFVESITSRDQVPAIVRGLLDLGRTLELEMIAEGVELEVQRDRLRAEHCDLAQGFLFAKPLDRHDAEVLLLHVAAGDDVRACATPQPAA